MTRDDLEARNWVALTRYGHALAKPGAVAARVQAAFVAELTANALAFTADEVSRALHPGWEDPGPLLNQAIDVLAGAMGVRQPRSSTTRGLAR